MTPTSSGQRNRTVGDYGERLALRRLTEAGLQLLDRNWRCEVGELDLVLREGRVLVVCEVKTRSGTDHGTPQEAVTPDKLARLRDLAVRWQEAHGVSAEEVRVDLVAVLVPRRGAPVVDHTRGIG